MFSMEIPEGTSMIGKFLFHLKDDNCYIILDFRHFIMTVPNAEESVHSTDVGIMI